MEKTPHCALSGDGALKFAKSEGFPYFEPNELIGPRIEKTWSSKPPYWRFDTVCAVAIDSKGKLACALSAGKEVRYFVCGKKL